MIGVKFRAYPTSSQKLALSQWMGCARSIWNAKCHENKYFYQLFKQIKRDCSADELITHQEMYYQSQDQGYAHFKDATHSPWLLQCPSKILANSASNWYNTHTKALKKQCGFPKPKPKTDRGSIHLTQGLFEFKGKHLYLGNRKFSLGRLRLKIHRPFKVPASIYVRKQAGQYFVSFCYDEGNTERSHYRKGQKPKANTSHANLQAHFNRLKTMTVEDLQAKVMGIDRGVVNPVYTEHASYDYSTIHQKRLKAYTKKIKHKQRKLAKQVKGSNRRQKTKFGIAKLHRKITHIRHDFAHKVSRQLVELPAQVLVFEDLNIQGMTKKPKAKKDQHGKFIRNQARSKAGLNKAILNVGWSQIERFTQYKALQRNKAVFKLRAAYTSQECASCGHIPHT